MKGLMLGLIGRELNKRGIQRKRMPLEVVRALCNPTVTTRNLTDLNELLQEISDLKVYNMAKRLLRRSTQFLVDVGLRLRM